MNFHNEEVQQQMLDEVEYWLKFGVDGFRFDVINFLFHDSALRNNPKKETINQIKTIIKKKQSKQTKTIIKKRNNQKRSNC